MSDAKRTYINNPVQIAECGGPCEYGGPEACDCGALWEDAPAPSWPESWSRSQRADETKRLLAIAGMGSGNRHAQRLVRDAREGMPLKDIQDLIQLYADCG